MNTSGDSPPSLRPSSRNPGVEQLYLSPNQSLHYYPDITSQSMLDEPFGPTFWPAAAFPGHSVYHSPQGTPFAGYEPSSQASGYLHPQNSNPLFMHSTRPSLTPASQTSSHIDTQISSSCLAQEPYSDGQVYDNFDHLRVMEESLQWPAGLNSSPMFAVPHVLGSTVVSTEPSYPDSLPAPSYTKQKSSPISSRISDYSGSDIGASARFDVGPGDSSTLEGRIVHTTLTEERPQRKTTTREEASYECTVEGCGKLFNRSYNYRAHMETHDPERVYPFICPVLECDKRFRRKTDLQRHHQSVHMKERNHQCEFCGRLFSRRDTLMRQVLPMSML
jgi:hypothetical protein